MRHLAERIVRLNALLPPDRHHPTVWQGSGWPAFREQVDIAVKQARLSIRIGTSVEPIREIAGILEESMESSALVTYGCWEGCPTKGCGVCRPPVSSLTPWTEDPACLVVVDGRLAVGSWGPTTAPPMVLSTDYAAVVAGWEMLVTPSSSDNYDQR